MELTPMDRTASDPGSTDPGSTDPGSPSERPTAVIAGGGIGGAAAALLLARDGWQVTMLERWPRRSPVGAGILLQPNGLAVLYGLGLREPLTRRAQVIRRVEVRSDRGRSIMSSAVPDFGHGLDHALALRRRDLLTALHDAVDAHPAITVVEGALVTAAHPDGRVHYEVAGREMGGVHGAADLVIGADGVHSQVRSSGTFGARIRSTGSTYGRALVGPVEGFVGEVWSRLGVFVSSSVGDATYFGLDVTHPEVADAVRRGDRDRFVELWSEAAPATTAIVEQLDRIDDLLVNAVEVVETSTFVDGRLVLVGDAAHAMEPTLGQGANSALVDVAVLARELAASDSIDDALRAYDAERRVPVQQVRRDADRLAHLGRVRSRIGRWFRDLLVRSAGQGDRSERRYRSAQQVDPGALYTEVARWHSAQV